MKYGGIVGYIPKEGYNLLKRIPLFLVAFLGALLILSTSVTASLSNATVEVSPQKTGEPVQVVLSFYVGSAGALEGGRDEVILYFPEGMTLPDSVHEYLPENGLIINGYSVDPNLLYCYGERLIITLPSEVNVRNNSYVGIIISPSLGIELPRKAGNHYLEIETSREKRVKTNSFSVEGSKISNLAVDVTPAAIDKFAEYEVTFRTSFQGGLIAEKDYLYLEFPANVYLPRSIVGEDVTVNGETVAFRGVTIEEATNTLKITVPEGLSIDHRADVKVKIDSKAGIRNPHNAGNYRLRVYTSADTVSTAQDYNIGMSINAPVVFVSPNGTSEKGQYMIGFTTSERGALRGGQDYIYLDFPSDTDLPDYIYTRDVTVNGFNAHYVETFPRNHYLRIKVPAEARIIADTYVNILIKKEAGLRNPAEAGSYRLAVSTTADEEEVKSKEYEIIKETPAPSREEQEGKSISLSSYCPQEITSLRLSFREGELGALRTGDKINMIFPVAYKIAGKINSRHVTLDGWEVEDLELIGQTLVFTVPGGIDWGENDYTEIRVTSEVGIQNPEKEDSYSILLCSSREYAEFLNYTVKISPGGANTNQPRITLELSNQEPGKVARYFVFLINETEHNLGKGDKISLHFPTGTLVPASISRSYLKINGEIPEEIVVAGNKITFTLNERQEIKEGAGITIFLEEDAGIVNPAKAGNYILMVEIKDNQFWPSEEYVIKGEAEAVTTENPAYQEGTVVFQIENNIAYFGSQKIELDAAPTILEGYTVVPLRALGDALGAETIYEETTKTVTVKYENKELIFYIDSKLVKINNEWKTTDIPATLLNNRVMIPVRFVSESFGATVVWEETTREVIITK